MPERTDRSIRDNRALVLLVAAFLLIAAAGGAYVWMRTHDREETKQGNDQRTSLVQPAFRNEPLAVTVYYPMGATLLSGTVAVKRQPDTQAQARETLAALLNDQRTMQAAVFRDIKLKAFFLDGQGMGYIDLAPSRPGDVGASAGEEFLALYALVNTVTQNFDEIKQVRFLLDGREAQTLAGHMDLSRTYTKRMDLVKQ